ncbi:ubiquitin fusion degradation protein UFD1, putative [Plasmodium knowlesi strain H]|uniref:Ubiquitin fusion degradation protein UFD1, putative n=3 Tax=Plasmodium knowlesi TaxID=5850 RepID=A0A5K1URP3_PLAKH|nr:ubiquitin fusion degradation protein 1, putative [Plasmodium knowlesi strain H]OTN67186.1 putative Ubiquitin fusion degradation protein UFD1 [Plasmodium knowlesi]CAA9988587.1 ubiquitin fusion degradation protein 1, putative [Plasmodium knowlesi strain H]SBO21403.1 ubiquitin fusion degradation protein UFD1, putative [Plasmodium knowlesi strain H]SBO21857.1 ubiquitin fusion degradation protein UFD1, putative [Plasmodium knowlesi strain H]VVS78061.1 ubiquitin fusion degradation protein 1, puta|eukprot:XP_002259563.1 Ubiquitin fusion degradation protein UFD1,putative [Plasmodium knowlesi strain H]
MDDDFLRAVNKFNANLGIHKKSSVRDMSEKKEKKEKVDDENANKLKEDLELHYIHNSNNKICQKFLTLPLSAKPDRLNSHSDKVILPVSILKTLEKGFYKSEVEFPYTFSLKNVQNNYITHVCVLEFSSNEGIIHVSENVKENLGIKQKSGIVRLLVTYANIPKCDFIKFESLNENTRNIKFMKNLLQNELNLNYSTLTLGDYVHINNLSFYISELEPDNAVSLINTDITVDICERKNATEKKDESSNCLNDFYEPINTTDVTINSTIKKGMKKYKYFFHYSVLDLLKKDKIEIKISLHSSGPTNNIDLYVSFPPYDSVSDVLYHLHFDDFSKDITINRDLMTKSLMLHFVCFAKEPSDGDTDEVKRGDNSLCISQLENDPFLEYLYDQYFPHLMYIAISCSAETEVQYTLSMKVITESEMETPKGHGTEGKCNPLTSSTAIKPTEIASSAHKFIKCNNCLKDILENNLSMHQIHCVKNISLCNICKRCFQKKDILNHIHCKICNEGISTSNREKHNYTWHTKIKCACEKYFYKKQFIFHQALFCPKKIIFCSYCNVFTTSSTSVYNEDYILANFLDKFDDQENFTSKSVPYYMHLIHTNFSYFVKYINHTEHEKYCGSKSAICIFCKTNMHRNRYLAHLMFFHDKDKKEAFTLINENLEA